MEDPLETKDILTVMAVAALVSFAAGFFLFTRHVAGQPLLDYEPRRRSPWGPLVLVLPLSLVSLAFVQLVLPSSAIEGASNTGFVNTALDFAMLQVTFVILAMLWLEYDRQADVRDLGIPESINQLWSDVVVGFVACAAALLPVFALNLCLVYLFEVQETHPMVERLMKSSSPQMLSAAFVAAVVAAPIFEEFVFRMLLQGWLERLEDESLGFQATERQPPVESALPGTPVQRPAAGWLGLLPHGWLPIVISSVFFGLAHLGHGVAPIPLVLLGLVLGYVYQRTHRIVPCIVIHMLFNGYSMVLLWMSLSAASQ